MSHNEFSEENAFGSSNNEHLKFLLDMTKQLLGQVISSEEVAAITSEKEKDRHIYQATKALGEYCIGEHITDIVFMDRKARQSWLALSTYFNLAHPEMEQPAMHFINPDMVEPHTDKWYDRLIGPIRNPIVQEAAYHQLAASNNTLLEKRDSPVLLFDICVHTGTTMKGVYDTLQCAG